MNKVELMGRLTRDPEIRYSQDEKGTCVARYTLAVDRRFKWEGEENADFIRCVVFGKQGEAAEKYLAKGRKVAVVGRIHTGSYTNKDGQKVYTTDVIVEEQHFCDWKDGDGGDAQGQGRPGEDGNGFMDIPEGIDEETPFD